MSALLQKTTRPTKLQQFCSSIEGQLGPQKVGGMPDLSQVSQKKKIVPLFFVIRVRLYMHRDFLSPSSEDSRLPRRPRRVQAYSPLYCSFHNLPISPKAKKDLKLSPESSRASVPWFLQIKPPKSLLFYFHLEKGEASVPSHNNLHSEDSDLSVPSSISISLIASITLALREG